MNIHWTRWVIAVLALLIFGWGSGTGDVQAKEKEVIFLGLSDYTGPIAGLAVGADMGLADYFKYINDKGGVEGIKLKFIGFDTRYDVARAISAYRKYRKTPGLLVVNGYSTGLGKAIERMATKDGLIVLTPGDGEFADSDRNIFLWGQCYQDAFAGVVDWMVKDWKKKGKVGMPTLGYIHWDNPLGREPLRGGKEYMEKIGVKFLMPEFAPPATPDYTPYLVRLQKANYIFVGGCDPTPTLVIRDAHRLGMTKNIQFMCDYWGPTMNVGIKSHPEALQGTVIVAFYLKGTDALAHPLIKKIWEKYQRKPISKLPSIYGLGMAIAMTYEAGLKMALKEVGYDNLTANAMYQTYQKLTGMNLTQGIQGKCCYGPKNRRGSKEIRLYRVVGQNAVPITDWIVPPNAASLHFK